MLGWNKKMTSSSEASESKEPHTHTHTHEKSVCLCVCVSSTGGSVSRGGGGGLFSAGDEYTHGAESVQLRSADKQQIHNDTKVTQQNNRILNLN